MDVTTTADYEVLTLAYDHQWYGNHPVRRVLGRSDELDRILNDFGSRGWKVVAACGDDRFRQVILHHTGESAGRNPATAP